METKNSEKPIDQIAENFYELLPRFVEGLTVSRKGGELQPIERTVYLDGKQFVFTISPARVIARFDETGEVDEQFRFPGDFEEYLESTLRVLSVPENIGFDRKKAELFCNLDQLRFGMSDFDDDVDDADDATESLDDRIEIAFSTLMNVEYILKRGESEFYFSPIQDMERRKINGKTHYRLAFSPFFFGDAGELFEQLFGD